jgi:hypothetical protein
MLDKVTGTSEKKKAEMVCFTCNQIKRISSSASPGCRLTMSVTCSLLPPKFGQENPDME